MNSKIYKSKSWLDLKPKIDHYSNKECWEDYYSIIIKESEYKRIPEDVLFQWIYPHHNNEYTLRNYSWINFETVEFRLYEWKTNQFEKLNIIKAYQEDVRSLGSHISLNQFSCNLNDLIFWQEKGTWRVPPIIIDVNSFYAEKPKWSELKKPFQLVEGHSRLGYLLSMIKIHEAENVKLIDKHKIYLMKKID